VFSLVDGSDKPGGTRKKNMSKRPLSVTILSLIFIASGVIGLAYHFPGLRAQHPFQDDSFWVALVRCAAIVCGVGMLRGSDWARWLALGWLAFHAVISAFHSASELLMHTLFLAVFAFLLFRPNAREYFRGKGTEAT
jgi:hypothetical protein